MSKVIAVIAAHADDEVLICSAVPAAADEGAVNKLVLAIR